MQATWKSTGISTPFGITARSQTAEVPHIATNLQLNYTTDLSAIISVHNTVGSVGFFS